MDMTGSLQIKVGQKPLHLEEKFLFHQPAPVTQDYLVLTLTTPMLEV